ncbi:MAG: hypothetical protein ACRD3J_04455 [Thermoanaerobaculia bacterium]
MAEEILLKELLTEEMKSFGAALTRKLDEHGWPVVASLWTFEPDGNRWTLILASPRVSSDGPLEAYGAVAKAVEALKLPMTNLLLTRVVEPKYPLVRAMASRIQTGWTIQGIPLSETAINGSFVEESYVYRVALESAAA